MMAVRLAMSTNSEIKQDLRERDSQIGLNRSNRPTLIIIIIIIVIIIITASSVGWRWWWHWTNNLDDDDWDWDCTLDAPKATHKQMMRKREEVSPLPPPRAMICILRRLSIYFTRGVCLHRVSERERKSVEELIRLTVIRLLMRYHPNARADFPVSTGTYVNLICAHSIATQQAYYLLASFTVSILCKLLARRSLCLIRRRAAR